MPVLKRVLETGIYVEDVPRARKFYEDVLGLEMIVADQRFCAYNVGGENILLLFERGGSRDPLLLPGGWIPGHDGSGHLHFAFAIEKDELQFWEERLSRHGIEIESRVSWPLGGTSLYFRDLDRNVLEIATRGIWPTY